LKLAKEDLTELAEIENEFQNKMNLILHKIKITSESDNIITGFITKTLDPIIAEFEKCVKEYPQECKTTKKPIHFIHDHNSHHNNGGSKNITK